MAEALGRLGHACAHEALFTPETATVPAFGDAQGDVSWLAAPFVSELANGTVVLHQVREPLATVRSMVGVRMFQTKPHALMQVRYRLQHYRIRFARPITNARFVRFAAEHCPGVFDLPDEASRAASYWVRWNQMIERSASRSGLAYRRFRVEALDDELLHQLDGLLGGTATLADVAAVRRDLGTNTHRARQVDELSLDAIGDPDTRAALTALGQEYGYAVPAR
jgi:hypothetical protein